MNFVTARSAYVIAARSLRLNVRAGQIFENVRGVSQRGLSVKKQQKQYETRMVLTVPTRGVITIEGSTKFVRDFFIDVKSSFVQALADALKYDAAMKGSDFEVIQTEVSPRETKLEIVEKSATTNQTG